MNAIRDNSAYGPETASLLDWLDTVLHLDQARWGQVLQAAMADQGWSDEETFRVAATVVEGDRGMRDGVLSIIADTTGVAAARAGATNHEQASFILEFARNAAIALLTRHAIPAEVFTKLLWGGKSPTARTRSTFALLHHHPPAAPPARSSSWPTPWRTDLAPVPSRPVDRDHRCRFLCNRRGAARRSLSSRLH